MSKPRLIIKNCYYHVMNRGDKGEPIFIDNAMKEFFLEKLIFYKDMYNISLCAFCIMNNHFHLIIRDNEGLLSKFMHNLLTVYAIKYRHVYEGKGYVFQNRFKAQIIQVAKYMQNVILYVLNNPCRKHFAKNPLKYAWSSAPLHFTSNAVFLNDAIVKDIFGNKHNFKYCINRHIKPDAQIIETPIGDVLGDQWYASSIAGKYDRRRIVDLNLLRRRDDIMEIPIKSAIMLFEHQKDMKLKDIDFNSKSGRIVRNDLLVFLRDQCHLSYGEIKNICQFDGLKYSTLAKIYSRCKCD